MGEEGRKPARPNPFSLEYPLNSDLRGFLGTSTVGSVAPDKAVTRAELCLAPQVPVWKS